MKKYMRVCADIDLDSIYSNIMLMRGLIKEDTKMIPVVKADGYGHGALPIARMLENESFVWGFALADAREAACLRKGGIKKPLLLLGGAFPDVYDIILKNDIRACVSSVEQAKGLSDAAVRAGVKVKIHVALDTGMSRIGFRPEMPALQDIRVISELPCIEIEGIFTHFARADEFDLTKAKAQFEKYRAFEKIMADSGIHIPIHHVSNSAAIFDMSHANLDAVRPGITMYGLMPSEEMEVFIKQRGFKLLPAMTLRSHVIYVKDLEPGREISYGGTFTVERPSRIATVPVGYADGYPRQLSGKGEVLIKGKRAPIRGRVCMDQFMVDVTDIPEVKPGDEVVLMGTQGNEKISAEEIGNLSGRFNYELVCDINKRVPRNYIREGQIVSQVDYLTREC